MRHRSFPTPTWLYERRDGVVLALILASLGILLLLAALGSSDDGVLKIATTAFGYLFAFSVAAGLALPLASVAAARVAGRGAIPERIRRTAILTGLFVAIVGGLSGLGSARDGWGLPAIIAAVGALAMAVIAFRMTVDRGQKARHGAMNAPVVAGSLALFLLIMWPGFGHSRQRVAAKEMRSALTSLVWAQERHTDSVGVHARDLRDLDYFARPGITIDFAATEEGWTATASNSLLADYACVVYEGGEAVPPATAPRQAACSGSEPVAPMPRFAAVGGTALLLTFALLTGFGTWYLRRVEATQLEL